MVWYGKHFVHHDKVAAISVTMMDGRLLWLLRVDSSRSNPANRTWYWPKIFVYVIINCYLYIYMVFSLICY